MLWLTFLLAEVLHLLLDAVIPVGDVHMQSIVATALGISPLTPLFIGLCQARLRFRYHMVNCKTEGNMSDSDTAWTLCLIPVLPA